MNSSLSRTIGFWTLVSIVVSSQVGSGIFMLPASLSVYGSISVLSWVFTGFGAILLALVFAELSRRFPKTGGPHTFVQEAFGKHPAFFIAWSYWVISWLSTTVVIIAAIGYLGALFGGFNTITNLILEIALLSFFTIINLRGLKSSGITEVIFTILKVIPLLLLPICCMMYFQVDYFKYSSSSTTNTLQTLSAAALTTFWGFIGIESATAPAESVVTPNKTIPRAIIVGTIIAALIYLICSIAIMGVVPPQELSTSSAPFADAAKIVFGGDWYYLISFAAAIVCCGTLNAWILVSGQIALGAAKDNLFPKIFATTNSNGAPSFAILLSSIGMIPALFFSFNDDLVSQFTKLIDMSVSVFLITYIVCTVSLIKILLRENNKKHYIFISIIALIFCLWALFSSGLDILLFALFIFLTGVPIYWIKIKNSFIS